MEDTASELNSKTVAAVYRRRKLQDHMGAIQWLSFRHIAHYHVLFSTVSHTNQIKNDANRKQIGIKTCSFRRNVKAHTQKTLSPPTLQTILLSRLSPQW